MMTWYLDWTTYVSSLRLMGDFWMGEATGVVAGRDWASRLAAAATMGF